MMQAPILFGGAVDFDGSIQWNQQVIARNSLFLAIRSWFQTREATSAQLITNKDFHFDGAKIWDGSKKFNANAVTEF